MDMDIIENESMILQSNASTNITPGYDPVEAAVDTLQLVLNFVLLVIGVTGNAFIICSVCVIKDLRTVSHALLASVAVCDSLICLLNIPTKVQSIISRGSWEPLGCAFTAYLVGVLPQVSIWYQALVSINRYVLITATAERYRKWFSPWKSAVMQALIWLSAGAHLISLLIRGTTTRYAREHDVCVFAIDLTASPIETIIHIVFFVALPFLVSVFAYLRIFIFLRKQARRVHTTSEVKRRELKIAYALVQMFVIYVFTEIPHLMEFLDNYVMYPRLLANFRQFLWWTNAAIDPFFYCWKIDAYRKPLTKLIRRICPNRRIGDNTSTQNYSTRNSRGRATTKTMILTQLDFRQSSNKCTRVEDYEDISIIDLPSSSINQALAPPPSGNAGKHVKFWVKENEALEAMPSTSSHEATQAVTGTLA